MSFGGAGDAAGGMADKEVQQFVMMEEQKAQFMMQKKDRKKKRRRGKKKPQEEIDEEVEASENENENESEHNVSEQNESETEKPKVKEKKAMKRKSATENINTDEQFEKDKVPGVEVVVGTYEELSLGYRLTNEISPDDQNHAHSNGDHAPEDLNLVQTFTDHSHAGCVRVTAVSRNGLLATGSGDEVIHLFNLRRNKELGSLYQHQGTITWIQFFSNSHMFSCSTDSTICLWSTRNWECLKTFRGHKGTVHCASFHPSGKLALSVGQDKTLRLWNLVSGRSAYTTNLKEVANLVKWSLDGEMYYLVVGMKIEVYKTDGAELEKTISCGSNVHCLEPTENGFLVGLESGSVKFYGTETWDLVYEKNLHENRVKCMSLLHGPEILATGSSDSKIKVWDWLKDEKEKVKLKAEVDTKFRITSLGAWIRKNPKQKKESETMEEEENEDVPEEPNIKKAKVEIEYEIDEPETAPMDKLAQRLMMKSKDKTNSPKNKNEKPNPESPKSKKGKAKKKGKKKI